MWTSILSWAVDDHWEGRGPVGRGMGAQGLPCMSYATACTWLLCRSFLEAFPAQELLLQAA